MRLKMLVILLIIALIPVESNVKETKTVYVLMEVLKINSTYDHLMNSSLASIENLIPDIPKEIIEMCRKEIITLDFLGKMASIYSSYFSEEEMKDLIDFYRTPTGQRSLVVMPMLQKEIFTHIENYKTEIINTCSAILQEKGYIEKE